MTLSEAANLICGQIWLGISITAHDGWALAFGVFWTVTYFVQVANRKLSERIEL